MAGPIRTIQASPAATSWEEILRDHAEGLTAWLEFGEVLARAGVLDFMRGMLEQKNGILKILLNQVNQSGPKNAINNLEGILSVIGALPPDIMSRAARAIDRIVKTAQRSDSDKASEKPLGPLRLMRALKDPDVSRTLYLLFAFLQEMGKELNTGH